MRPISRAEVGLENLSSTARRSSPRRALRKIDSTITSDWDAARTAVNLGRPIAEVVQKSPLVSDIGKLVQMMLPEEIQAAAPVEGKRRRRG